MLVIRSVVFNVLFYLNLLVQLIAALPTLVMPRWGILAVAMASHGVLDALTDGGSGHAMTSSSRTC